MNTRIIILPLLIASLTSCDKIQELSLKLKAKLNQTAIVKQAPADPELEKLVDRTAEGVIFRKDLPFPLSLEVTSSRQAEISSRRTQSSAIEKSSETLNGIQTSTRNFKRTGNQVSFTIEPASAIVPKPDPLDTKKIAITKPIEKPVAKPTITFTHTPKGWKSKQVGDFKSVVISRELSPVFEHLLQENALSPRPLWFANKRMKPGDSLVVSGDSLAMLFSSNAKGSLSLKLESFEPVEGHPCGVFSISGSYSRKNVPDFDASFADEDVSIESGKVWLSLVYPIVLKQEIDTIRTLTVGSQGGLVSRNQGSAKVSQTFTWKPLNP